MRYCSAYFAEIIRLCCIIHIFIDSLLNKIAEYQKITELNKVYIGTFYFSRYWPFRSVKDTTQYKTEKKHDRQNHKLQEKGLSWVSDFSAINLSRFC